MKGFRWALSVGFSHCQQNRHSVALSVSHTLFAMTGRDSLWLNLAEKHRHTHTHRSALTIEVTELSFS